MNPCYFHDTKWEKEYKTKQSKTKNCFKYEMKKNGKREKLLKVSLKYKKKKLLRLSRKL
jgi:hypothetical protein